MNTLLRYPLRFVLLAGMFAALLFGSESLHAQPVANEQSAVPRSAHFFGLGVGYGFTKFGSQSVYNKGISNVFQAEH